MVATSTAPADITADRLSNLRKEMKQDGLDCIIVPTEDPHMSEYTAPYYYRREYISGFTGEMTLQTYQHPNNCIDIYQLLMMLSNSV
jgi:Creatinase/Prolidase N-terminal domain